MQIFGYDILSQASCEWTEKVAKVSHLDSGAPAFTNSIGHSSTRGVNHGHKANEAQLLGGEVHLLSVKSKTFWELVIRQVEMLEQECILQKMPLTSHQFLCYQWK
uniref:Uncharacterized protein n=1 Tax=Echeneis naucrates TaxID=173247 RepID=A0A665X267_ECHNA